MAVRSPPSDFKEMRPMDATMIEEHLENIDQRLTKLEQILPTLATKDEFLTLATKEELKTFATKEELRAATAPLATKAELQAAIAPLATKAELQAAIAPLATKEELHATEATLRGEIRDAAEQSRRHVTMLIEHQDAKLQLIAEHVLSLMDKRR
jgi:DNA repair exonuclease SbcCD ATPase subunit